MKFARSELEHPGQRACRQPRRKPLIPPRGGMWPRRAAQPLSMERDGKTQFEVDHAS